MIQILRALVAICFTYFLPGYAVSYALFPGRMSLSGGERLVVSFGLGPGIVTFIMFLEANVLHSFNLGIRTIVLSIIVIGSLGLYRYQRKPQRWDDSNDLEEPRDRYGLPSPFIGIFVLTTILIILLSFYHALNFPIVTWDSLTEFAYLGRLYYEVGGMPTITGATLGVHSSANFPPFIPLLYTWFYTIFGGVEELFAKAVSPIFAVFTVLVVYILSKKINGSKTTAWASVFFMVSTPIFMFAAEDCLSDMPLVFYVTSSIFFLYVSLKDEERRDRAAIAGGLFGGLAAWTKYTGLLAIPVSLAIIILVRFIPKWMETDFRISLRQIALFLVFFALLGAPWYMRNWVHLGNPVYPHLHTVFGGKNLDPWLMENGFHAYFSQIRASAGLNLSIANILLTYFTIFFQVPPFEMLDMGPFLGAFTLVGTYFIRKKRDKRYAPIITWILVFTITWRVTLSVFLRYLLAVVPAFAILSGLGMCKLYASVTKLHTKPSIYGVTVSMKRMMGVLVFLVILGGTFLPTMVNSIRGYKTWAFVNPAISDEEFIETRLPDWWKALEHLNGLPKNTVILTYDHSVRYYTNRTCLFVDEPQVKGIHVAENMLEVMLILKQHNVTHILDVRYFEEVEVLRRRSYFFTQLNSSTHFEIAFHERSVLIYSVKE